MIIDELLKKQKMSRYRLSKESGVAMTTITDICNGKADLEKCASGTLYKIAKVLGVTVDSLLENNKEKSPDYRCNFETFRSNTRHHVKDLGGIDFVIETLETDEIRRLYDRQWYRESLYLLAMTDYLSRMNNLPICTKYNDIRNQKLEQPYFPANVVVSYAATGDENIKKEAVDNAIPEFMRFNIVEGEVCDVCGPANHKINVEIEG
jgi:transcriptional regulator with XRE-family HTH domain